MPQHETILSEREMTTTAESAKASAYEILPLIKTIFQNFGIGWDGFLSRWAPKNNPPSFRFECAYCGDQSEQSLADVEFLDSGTQLKCESCQRPTIVGLFTVVEYGRACNVLGDKR